MLVVQSLDCLKHLRTLENQLNFHPITSVIISLEVLERWTRRNVVMWKLLYHSKITYIIYRDSSSPVIAGKRNKNIYIYTNFLQLQPVNIALLWFDPFGLLRNMKLLCQFILIVPALLALLFLVSLQVGIDEWVGHGAMTKGSQELTKMHVFLNGRNQIGKKFLIKLHTCSFECFWNRHGQ